jgi:L-iditol 2-dehydrogenase
VLDISAGFHAPALQERMGGALDVVVPACPDPRALEWGLELLRPGGRLVLFSGLAGSPRLDLNQLHYRELALVGAYGCNAGQNRRALEILARRAGKAEALISARLPLERVAQALEMAASGRGLKVVVEMWAESQSA